MTTPRQKLLTDLHQALTVAIRALEYLYETYSNRSVNPCLDSLGDLRKWLDHIKILVLRLEQELASEQECLDETSKRDQVHPSTDQTGAARPRTSSLV